MQVINAGHSMPKLQRYVSYAALAAALVLGFAVTAHTGFIFGA